MPNYVVTLPSGKKFQVNGAANQADALQKLRDHQAADTNARISPDPAAAGRRGLEAAIAQPSPPLWGGWGDLAKSAGTGLTNLATDVAGLPGAITDLETAGLNKLFGATPEDIKRMEPYGRLGHAPTPGELTSKIEQTTGPLYQPKSIAGEALATGMEYLPQAVGPGAVRTIPAAIKTAGRVLLPTAATEGTRMATRGTSAESWAPALAGLGAGVGSAAKLGSKVPIGQAVEATAAKTGQTIPNLQQAHDIADQAWNALRRHGVTYDRGAFAKMTGDIANELYNKGFRADPDGAASTYRRVKEMWSVATNPKKFATPNFDDLNAIRKAVASTATTSANRTDRQAAKLLWRRLDDFMQSAPMTSQSGISPKAFGQEVAAARDLSSRYIKGRELTGMTGASEGYATGAPQGLRLQYGSLTKRIGKYGPRGYTPAEQQAVKDVHKLTLSRATGLGTARPFITAGIGQALGGATLPILGPVGPAVINTASAVAPFIAKPFANAAVRKAAERAINVALAGKPLQAQAGKYQRAARAANTRQLLYPAAPALGGLLGP